MRDFIMKKIIILLLSIAIAVVFLACNNPQESSSATSSTTSLFTSTYSELASSEETLSMVSQEDVSSNVSVPEPPPSSSSPNEGSSSTAPTPTTSSIDTASSSSTAKVVQMADPETGISWDGVSSIVYTYPDGTTGTEKREGATYEQVPGVINTIVGTEHVEYDGKCSDCGKTEGDGTNGSCVQWLMGDVDCPNCGEHVEVRTCHTCG